MIRSRCIRAVVPAMLVVSSFAMSVRSIEAQTKTVLVVSVAGVDSLISDIGFLTKSAGAPEYGQMATMMAQPYTQGLDKTRPIGVVVNTDGQQFIPLGFIPVTDLKAFLAALSDQIGEPQDAGNGVLELAGPTSLFVKEQNGWAFVARNPDALGTLPADPVKLLGDLTRDYDIAIQANIPNVPEMYRQMAMGAMKSGVQAQLDRQSTGNDPQTELQRKLMQNQMKQWEVLMTEVDQLTLGWHIDSQAGKTYLDLSMTAVEGTKTAEQMALLKDTKSSFNGLLSEDSAVTFNVTSTFPQDQIQDALVMLDSVQNSAKKEIDNDENLPDRQTREAMKDLISGLFDVAKATIREGKVDCAAAVNLAPQAMTVLLAGYVANGSQLEETLKKLVDLAKDEPGFPGVNLNADQHAGVNFHTMSVNIPEGEDARRVFGDQLDVAVGIGKDSFYLALGKDGLSQLKSSIDASNSGADTVVPPFQMSIGIGQILKFASSVEDNPVVAAMARALESSAEKDHIVIKGKPVNNGVVYRFEIEEGVLRAIGGARQAAGGAF